MEKSKENGSRQESLRTGISSGRQAFSPGLRAYGSESAAKRHSIRQQKDGKPDAELLGESAALICFFAWFFYRSPAAVLFLIPLAIPYIRFRRKQKTEKYREQLTEQFKEALGSMLTAMKAGFSAENAVRETYEEMKFLYGAQSPICREFQKICRGLDSHVPLEQLMNDFGEYSRIEAIREFAQTFTIAKRSGGNMTEIMSRTVRILQDGMDVEKEINILVSARKLEQRIMNLVPFLIVGYVSVASRGFFTPLYHNPAGIFIMSICLAVYVTAFAISEKISAIPV